MFVRRIAIITSLALAVFCGLVVIDLVQPFWYTRLRTLYRDGLIRCGRTAPADPRLVFETIFDMKI